KTVARGRTCRSAGLPPDYPTQDFSTSRSLASLPAGYFRNIAAGNVKTLPYRPPLVRTTPPGGLWPALAHCVRYLHAPRRGHLDAGEQRQAFRESFSVPRAVPRPATSHDDRFHDGRAGACIVARFAQPERKIVQVRGETRLIMNRAAMHQAAISIDRLAARFHCALAIARLG